MIRASMYGKHRKYYDGLRFLGFTKTLSGRLFSKVSISILLLFLILITSSTTRAETGRTSGVLTLPAELLHGFQPIGDYGLGDIRSAVISEGMLYIGTSFGLRIFNISDPQKIFLAGELPVLQGIDGLVLNGNQVYAYGTRPGLSVIDISDPANPRIVGFYNPERRRTTQSNEDHNRLVSLAKSGRYIIIGIYNNGLEVLDVSKPESPRLIGKVEEYIDHYAMETCGSYLFTFSRSGMEVFDMSEPSDPKRLTTVPFVTGVGNGVAIRCAGDRLFALHSNKLIVYDIANPSAPKELSSIEIASFGTGLQLYGDKAFVANGANGLKVFDVSNPEELLPVDIELQPNPSWKLPLIKGALIENDNLYLFGEHGFAIYRADDLSRPETAYYEDAKKNGFLAFQGDIAYLFYKTSQGDAWLETISLRDPSEPTYISRAHFEADRFSYSNGMAVHGDYLYVGFRQSVLIFDTRNKQNVTQVSSVKLKSYISALTVNTNGLFVLSQDGLEIYNLEDPINPQKIGAIEGKLTDFAVSGDILTVSSGDGAVKVYDCGTITTPQLITAYYPEKPEHNYIKRVATNGDFIFALTPRKVIAFRLKGNSLLTVDTYSNESFYDGSKLVLADDRICAIVTKGIWCLKLENGESFKLISVLPTHGIYEVFPFKNYLITMGNGFQVLKSLRE